MRPMHISSENQFGESIAARYPRDFELADARRLTLTPMVPSDWPYLERFLHEVPESERQFFRQDTSIAERVKGWCASLDYRHVLPLLAWNGDQIVGDATLEQEPGLWTAHVAKIRILVHPDFRRHGVGARLLHELVELAREAGLHKVVCECAAEQAELIEHYSRNGFTSTARLPDFIRDRHGKLHDMVLMVRDLNG